MQRRQFIGLASVGAASLAWPAATRAAEVSPSPLAQPHLLDVLRDPRLVHDLGLRYRASVPAEDRPSTLERAILAETRGVDSTPLRARVGEQVQRDFAQGRTVMLDGWVLSVTEARQCALYSLRPA